tara:strand:+ start:36 stop:485 length:450 start_codon:yes stop_codon:yes gene_type:complete
MKKGRLQEIVKELKGASAMHLKQSKEIKSHIDDMSKGPGKTTMGDVAGYATNFLKGAGGVAASLLSTTSAEAGQNIRSQAQFDKENPTNKGVVHDGGTLPNSKPKEEMGAAKKKTSCWKGYSNIVNGKPTFKKKGKRMVPDCKPTGKKK